MPLLKPDTTTLVPLSGLMGATIPKNSIVSQDRSQLMRDSIADRQGLWKSVRTMTRTERHISLAEPDVAKVVPFTGLMVATIPKTPIVPQDGSQLMRDSIADRQGLRKTARPIKRDNPPYPRVAKREGWEGTVVLRMNISADGDVGKVTIQESSGYPALDESAMQSAKTWRFDPAKDGEFSVSAVVFAPVTFNLEEHNRQ